MIALQESTIVQDKEDKCYLRFLYKTGSLYIFLEVDKENNPLIKKRSWATHPEEQKRIYGSLDKLEIWDSIDVTDEDEAAMLSEKEYYND